jgi:hypothetical protein
MQIYIVFCEHTSYRHDERKVNIYMCKDIEKAIEMANELHYEWNVPNIYIMITISITMKRRKNG